MLSFHLRYGRPRDFFPQDRLMVSYVLATPVVHFCVLGHSLTCEKRLVSAVMSVRP